MRSAVLLVMAVLAAPGLLDAQRITSPYQFIERIHSVTLQGGYLETHRGERDLAPHSGPVIAARYSGRMSGPLSGEAGVLALPTQRTFYVPGPTPADPAVAVDDVSAHILVGDAGFRFSITGPRTWNNLAPFVGASVGVAVNLAGRSAAEREAVTAEEQLLRFGPSFAMGGMAGTDWFITDRLSIRASARTVIWRITTPAGFAGVRETDWLPNFGLTIGPAFHL
jgi:hypothetical protein